MKFYLPYSGKNIADLHELGFSSESPVSFSILGIILDIDTKKFKKFSIDNNIDAYPITIDRLKTLITREENETTNLFQYCNSMFLLEVFDYFELEFTNINEYGFNKHTVNLVDLQIYSDNVTLYDKSDILPFMSLLKDSVDYKTIHITKLVGYKLNSRVIV